MASAEEIKALSNKQDRAIQLLEKGNAVPARELLIDVFAGLDQLREEAEDSED